MPLPKCVKCDAEDSMSRTALIEERWRLVGILQTYFGSPREQGNWPAEIADYKPGLTGELLRAIEWSGRLWRDSEVSQQTALTETLKILHDNEPQTYVIGSSPSAFAVFRGCELLLIGVHPKARGLGLGKALIRNAMLDRTCLLTGTYSDNKVAVGMYHSLGMSLVRSEAVFHK